MSNGWIRLSYLRHCPMFCMAAFLLMCWISCRSTAAPSKLPYGYLDGPVGEQVIRGTAPVSGWAVSEDGIESVAVYVDRNFIGRATIGQSRPDVAKVLPDLAESGSSGWSLLLDTALLAEGRHEITVQIRSKRGAYRDLPTVPVTVTR